MRLILTLFLTSFFAWGGKAQATAHFTASATIIQPISISTISNLNFANIDAKEGGEVILSPQGERRAIGSVELADASNITAATFEVVGERDYTFSISLPEDQAGLVNGSEDMVLKDFTSSQGSAGYLNNGRTTITVGATLVINSQQAPGSYSSPVPLNITVNYN